MNVVCVVHQPDAGPGVFGDFPVWVPSEGLPPALDSLDALMVFGGSMHVDQGGEHPWLDAEKRFLADALARGTPVLGVCLGSQLLAEAAGARPYRADEPEIGWYDVEVTDAGAADPVVGPLAPRTRLFAWHHYVAPLPPGAVELARTPACVQAFRLDGRPAWGLQFHAEVTRENLLSWLDGWDESEAVHADLDPARIRADSERLIAGQHAVGRGIAERFLAEAARVSPRGGA